MDLFGGFFGFIFFKGIGTRKVSFSLGLFSGRGDSDLMCSFEGFSRGGGGYGSV